ncbi:MAG: efflux RND transporter periplasmic adaptor subunit [Synechococcaceae cyanobacterium]
MDRSANSPVADPPAGIPLAEASPRTANASPGGAAAAPGAPPPRRWAATRLWRKLPPAWRPLLLLLPITAALVLRGLQNSDATAPRRPPPLVSTAAVTQGPLEIRYPINAEVRPLVSVEVRPEVDGKIQRLFFQEGTLVRRGQPLALIHPTPYQLALDQAEANAGRAQARLTEAKAQQRLAAAQLKLAADRARRYGGLSREGALSRDDEENYLTQEQVARANLEAQAGAVASARADLHAARAAVAAARINLDHTLVRAPITGRIGQQRITLGNLVREQENRPLVVINQISPLDAVFAVSQRWKDQVEVGQPLSFAGRGGLRGRVISIDNTTNASTGTVMVKARLEGDTTNLTPGESLEGSLLLRRLDNSLLLPEKAIQQGQRGPFVYAARQGKAVLVPVVIVGSDQGRSAVRADLAPGDQVVVAGQFALRPGGRLRLPRAPGAAERLGDANRPGAEGGGGAAERPR